ncbi:hypothetical protein WJ542_09955 [Paraburkholderia sp. B3]
MAAEFETGFEIDGAGREGGARDDLFMFITFLPDTTRVAGALIS